MCALASVSDPHAQAGHSGLGAHARCLKGGPDLGLWTQGREQVS